MVKGILWYEMQGKHDRRRPKETWVRTMRYDSTK